MPEPRLRAVCLAALILVPVGCAWISGSRAKGEWHPARGEPVPVTLRFDSDGRGGGRVETTLGYRVQPLIQSWHSVWRTGKHSLEPDPWLDGSGGAMTFIRRYDGHVVAELSSGARVMRCRFELSRPGWGPRGGGPGECQLSDGSEIRAEL
jgi:hypothetical protein